MTGVLYRKMEIWTEKQREDSHVKKEAGIGVMLSQAKDHGGLPEAGRKRKDPPPDTSEGAWPCQHLDFGL